MKKQKVLSALLAMTMFCTMAPPAAALAEETNTEAVEDYSSDHSLEVMGGKLGKDYTIENGVITVKTSTPLTIYGAGENVRGKIVISENVEANIALEALRLFSQDGAALEISKNSTANVKGVNDDLNNENGDFSSLSGSDQSQAILIQNSGMLNIDVEGGCRLNCEGVIKNDGSIAIDGSGIFEIGEYQSNPSVDGGKMIVNNGIVRFYSIDVDKFEVNGGEVGVRNEESGAINADKCVINNGLIDWFIENYDSWNNDDVIGPRLFVSDSLQIKGGDFYGGNISRNSVYGCPVVDGKAVSVKQFNEDRGYPKFTVVDDDQINSLQVSGTGGSYKNRVLTLNDGADVIISSKGQTNDNIQVGDYNNPVHATLTLSGVDIHSAKPTIFVEEGSSLTLILKDGTNNRLQSVGAEMSAIRVKDYDRYDHSDSVLTIQGKETLNVQGRNSGIGAAGGQINIENGNIIATLGSSAFGAAIGGEYRSHAQINISGGTIKAEGATGIGSGYGDADIMISGGNIEAIGHLGAAIGNGNLGQGGSILIEDGHIYATTDCGSAAIGGGVDSSIEEITIKGGNIIAETKPESYYQSSGAAIGTGYARGNLDNPDQERNSSVGNISISGGNIIAKSGTGAAAIGSGQSLDGYITQVGFIEITGGTVEAYGGKGAAGIGAGKGGIDGTFSTGDGDPVIITNSISDQNSESVWNGVFIVDNMNKGIGKVYGDTVTPTADFTIPDGKTLEVDAGQQLIVADGITATNNGTVMRDKDGVVDVQGTWLGNPVMVKGEEEGTAVTGVQLSKNKMTLQPGKSKRLTATVLPETAENKNVTWQSSDERVATVNKNGRVTAAGEGTAVITVTTEEGGFTAQCKVTVSQKAPETVAVDNVALSHKRLTMNVGETATLAATVSPADATNKNVSWKSNDEDVVSVDANGKLTAVESGTATVTVTTEDGNFTALCKVTVVDPDDTTTDTETKPDGSTETTVEDANGSSSTTVVKPNGESETSVTLSNAAMDAASKNDTAVILPMMGVKAQDSMKTAPSVTVDLQGRDAVQVEIPVLDMTPGTVAVLVDAGGNETILKNSVLGNNGLIVTLSDGDEVKILDNTKQYGDVAENHWAKNVIDYVTSRELFVGVTDDSFAPEAAMNRAMIVSVLQRYAGDDTAAKPGDAWYEGARKWAMANGVCDGTNMEGNVTREQLVTMLYRYVGSPQVVGGLNGYADRDSVSSYAQQAMVWAVRNNIISGMTSDTLAPQGLATRAQVAAIFERFIEWEQTA